MKKCYKCNVTINSSIAKCPLCGSRIDDDNRDESVFPIIPSMYTKHKLVFKLLLFASVLGCVVCSLINYVVSKDFRWSLFVIAGIVSFWATFITGVKRRGDFIKLLFGEIMLLIIASVVWDYFTGWYFWSVTFVLPFLCIAYITTLFILRIFLKNIFKDHIIYIYVNSLIGLVPMYFLLADKLLIEWPSLLCVIFSVLSLVALAIFNHKQMKNELERRLHI